VDVAMVAFAREEGAPAAAGVLIGLFATGSLVAGVVYGAKDWRTPPQRRFLVAVAVFALGTVPVALSANLPLMALTVTLAGVAIAPMLISGYALVRTQVPSSVLTRASPGSTSPSSSG
jgi:MFS family permease